jgi:hypothetical protein
MRRVSGSTAGSTSGALRGRPQPNGMCADARRQSKKCWNEPSKALADIRSHQLSASPKGGDVLDGAFHRREIRDGFSVLGIAFRNAEAEP